jgi:hypothetical protein
MCEPRLRDLLAKFLKGEEVGKYPSIEARILSLSPLQITDDQKTFIDLSSLEDAVTEELEGSLAVPHVLVLQDWKFVLRRIPNSHEYYFDLSVNRYKLQPTAARHLHASQDPIKMEDDKEIRYHFEIRKRQEIEKMVRGTAKDLAPKPEAQKKSPAKTLATKEDTFASALPSEAKQSVPEANVAEFHQALHKPSTAKTEDAKASLYFESSFFKKAGIVSANTKLSIEDALYLMIADIMSVPVFIPHAKRSVIRPIPLIRLRRSLSAESDLEELQRESIGRMIQRHSTESSRNRDRMDFEEMHDHIMAGSLKWSQLVVNRASFEHLKKNRYLLELAD